MSAILEVVDLRKYFETPRGLLHAVDGVSFAIERGKTLGVVGESGCGKSTLGRTVIHLQEPTSGTIVFEGRDISRVDEHRLKDLREDMQMIFQDPFSSLNPRMSVGQLIAEPLLIYKKHGTERELARHVARLMDTVGLARRLANSYPHELDGGRRQRIGVARALALEPKFIVCDEPVSALDVSIQAQIINLMQDLQEAMNLTYMFITHDMSVVRHVSDDIMVMYLGSMVEFADSEEMFNVRLHPYTQALLAAVPIPVIGAKKERSLLKGEITSPVGLGDGCRFAKRCPHAEDRCFRETPRLDELRPRHFVACHRAREINRLSLDKRLELRPERLDFS
ncbi:MULTISPECIES: ABC transporter ATP-binding protein [unclassified Pyramidobacter]|uniref:ABC transporter ATP-binding protein n=1 Tax=unclassified Pyramidobacter TaxID=2632171 RepID=UPI00098EB01A|nr:MULTISPECIES: oligopeptide/dipeptide ABC transporter ATP-binding protein [unclassified Pyramidobacter]OON89362.1 peptide ABC transporter ATP-binding protein [Pyramidobacter sp. C12-8]RKJ79240.1 ATP-binding cassette domain-containing protein [Pyramidobacter sp. CG50-2]